MQSFGDQQLNEPPRKLKEGEMNKNKEAGKLNLRPRAEIGLQDQVLPAMPAVPACGRTKAWTSSQRMAPGQDYGHHSD